jgi:hypothetical protein
MEGAIYSICMYFDRLVMNCMLVALLVSLANFVGLEGK